MGAVEELMCVVCVRVTNGATGDGCDLASTLCKYDLFVPSWARVQRVRREFISSERKCVRSILLLPLVVRWLETIDVCIWRMSVLVIVWGSVGIFVV